MTRLSPQLYRTALDLVAARQQDEYAVFEVVLEELSGAPDGLGVLGVLAVTNLSVRQASAVGRCPASRVLDGLRVQPVPAAQPVVPAVLTLLYTATEDLGEASRLAHDLGSDDRAEPCMVVLADVSIAMAERLTAFCGVPQPQIIASWRQQAEAMIADDSWAA